MQSTTVSATGSTHSESELTATGPDTGASATIFFEAVGLSKIVPGSKQLYTSNCKWTVTVKEIEYTRCM